MDNEPHIDRYGWKVNRGDGGGDDEGDSRGDSGGDGVGDNEGHRGGCGIVSVISIWNVAEG